MLALDNVAAVFDEMYVAVWKYVNVKMTTGAISVSTSNMKLNAELESCAPVKTKKNTQWIKNTIAPNTVILKTLLCTEVADEALALDNCLKILLPKATNAIAIASDNTAIITAYATDMATCVLLLLCNSCLPGQTFVSVSSEYWNTTQITMKNM